MRDTDASIGGNEESGTTGEDVRGGRKASESTSGGGESSKSSIWRTSDMSGEGGSRATAGGEPGTRKRSGECAPRAHVRSAGTHQRGRQKLEEIVNARVGVKLEFQNAYETTGLTPLVEPSRRHEAKATI